MMGNGLQLGALYLLMAAMLLFGMLMSWRSRAAQRSVMVLAWISIFSAGFMLFTFRDDLGYVAQRLRTEATGEPIAIGREVRIPMSIDGHFWVHGRINGEPVKFLVDSGATVTTIDRMTASRAGIPISEMRNQMVRTGNGVIQVASGRAQRVSVDTIDRENISLHIADTDDMNVLGMNFLSTLSRWSVEGRWLVLQS